jgi:hypothetical protein
MKSKGPHNNGMHPTADTLPVKFIEGAARRVMPSVRFLLSGRDRRMRTISTLLLTFILAVGCLAQGDKSKITPTPDPTAPSKVYIPKDLEDAFVELCESGVED